MTKKATSHGQMSGILTHNTDKQWRRRDVDSHQEDKIESQNNHAKPKEHSRFCQ